MTKLSMQISSSAHETAQFHAPDSLPDHLDRPIGVSGSLCLWQWHLAAVHLLKLVAASDKIRASMNKPKLKKSHFSS